MMDDERDTMRYCAVHDRFYAVVCLDCVDDEADRQVQDRLEEKEAR